MISPSPFEAQRRYEARSKPSLLSRIPWGTVLASGVFLGVVAWGWYRFEWEYRLPQEHTLTDKQGQTISVLLEAHNNELLQYQSLIDNSTRFVTIESLSDKDQEFVRQLPSELSIKYPLVCFMAVANASPTLIRIEGHDADWVRYTTVADHTTHYAPMASLASSDQVLLGQLPSELTVEPPVNRVLTDLAGQGLSGRAVGRSADLLKTVSEDGAFLYYPLRELSSLDQKLVQLLPANIYLHFPFESTLTDKAGKKLKVTLEGRSADTVKYTLLNDGQSYYAPATDFSTIDQEVFRLLPSKIDFVLPLDYTLTDAKGQSLHLRIEARNAGIVKFVLLENGSEHYWPNSTFSTESRNFLNALPADLKLEFPIDGTLTSQTGQALQAHIIGRNADSVKFQLVDGKTYILALTKLSDESQTFMRMLPVNLNEDGTSLSGSPVKSLATDTQNKLKGLRSNLTSLISEDRTLQSDMDAYVSVGANTDTRKSLQTGVDNLRDQMEDLCKQVNLLLDPATLQGKSKEAQSTWMRIMSRIKSDDGIRVKMTSADSTERGIMREDIRSNQVDIVSALNELNLEIGAYSP